MSYQFPPDIEQLVREHMAQGHYASEHDLLREALGMLRKFTYAPAEANREYKEAIAAVHEGVTDMENGRMTPLRKIYVG